MTERERELHRLPTHTTASWRYGPRTRTQIGIIGAVVFGLLLPIQPIAAVIAVLFTLLLTLPSNNGRTFNYSLIRRAIFNRRLKKERGRLGSQRISSLIYSDDEKDTLVATNPIHVNFLPMDEIGQEYLTEVHTPDNSRHTLYVLFDSWGDADINDAESYLDLGGSFAQACRNLAGSYGPGLRVTMFRFTVPHDHTGDALFFEQNRFVSDNEDEVLERLHQDFREAIELQKDYAVDYLCGIAINVVRPTEWSKLQPQNLKTADIVRSSGYQLAEQLIDYLRTHGASNVRRPGPYESALLLRGSLDPKSLPKLYGYRQQDLSKFGMHDFRTLEDSMVLAGGVFPEAHELVVKRDYLRVADSTYTRTFNCPEFSTRQVEPGYMKALYRLPPEIQSGIALTYRVGDPKFEQRAMKHRLNVVEAKKLRREYKGQTARASEEDLEVQVREQDAALYFSGGDTLHLHLLSCVSADSPEKLDENSDVLVKRLQGTAIPMEVIRGETTQYQARLELLGIASA